MKSLEQVVFRTAHLSDLSAIIRMLNDDVLGSQRESLSTDISPEYVKAFLEIDADPNNEIIVGSIDDALVSVLQMTYIPNLTLKGTKRVLIEGVRVSSDFRGQGLGQKFFDYAFNRAKERGCHLAQLTTNKSRVEAIHFYEKLGFISTHEGMKRDI